MAQKNKNAKKKEEGKFIDQRILSQILVAQNILFVLPNVKSIAEYYLQALMSIPGIYSCRICMKEIIVQSEKFINETCNECKVLEESGQAKNGLPYNDVCKLSGELNTFIIPIETPGNFFGFFIIFIKQSDVFEPYKPYISNMANHVALNLENRLQKSLLQTSNIELEKTVLNRTKELRNSYSKLESEIIEKNSAKATLQEQYSTLLGIIESSDSPIFSIDQQYRYTSFNSSHVKMMKKIYGADILIGCSLLESMSVDKDREKAKENIDRALNGEQFTDYAFSGEKMLSRLYFEVTHNPIRNECGQVIGVAVISRDVTEKKQAEQKNVLMNFALNNVREAAFLVDKKARFHYVNEEACRILGYDYSQLLKLGVQDIDPDFPSGRWVDHWEILEKNHSLLFESRHQTKQGNIFPVEINANYFEFDGQGYNLALVRDITERKQVEAILLKSESELKEAQRISRLGSWDWDATTDTISWSEEYYLIYGLDPKQNPPGYVDHLKAYTPESAARLDEAVKRNMKTGESYELDLELFNADVPTRWVTARSESKIDNQGNIVGLRGTVLDITERKRNEEALQLINRKLRALSKCNEILLRADEEQTLLNEICRIICDDAGYQFAWVGFANDDTNKTVRPVAKAGIENGYLTTAYITWDENERGRGPTGTAIRNGIRVCFQDFKTDPLATPWRDEALKRGYRSSIALPLKDGNAITFGVLNIYSSEPNTFTPDEIRLLDELAADLAFGISVLRARLELKITEEALQEKIQHSQSLLRLSRNLESAQTYSEVLNSALVEVETIVGYKSLWVYLFTEEKEYANLLIASGKSKDTLLAEKDVITLTIKGDRMLEEITTSREIVVVEDARTDDRTNKDIVAKIENRTIVNVPIILIDRYLGSVGTGTFGIEGVRVPSKSECEYLTTMASHMAVTLDRIHLLEERKKAEEERKAHIVFLERLEQVNQAIIHETNIEQMLQHVMQTVISIFGGDRAWLFYPCDPDAPTFRVPVEMCRPEYPGANVLNQDVPIDAEMANDLREILNSESPLTYRINSDRPVNDISAQHFAVQSQIVQAIFPKIGKPWVFGLHQCSYARIWSSEEKRLFQEIGRRISDALSNLLMLRNLRDSEIRYREIFESTTDLMVICSVTEDKRFQFIGINPAGEKIIGISSSEFAGKYLEEFRSDDQAGKILQYFEECLEKKAIVDFEDHLITTTGHWYLHTTLLPIFNDNGIISRIISVSRNITERKFAEEALRKSEQRLNLALQIGQIGAFELNLADGRGTWTTEFASIFEIPKIFRGNMMEHCVNRIYPEDYEFVRERFDEILQNHSEGQIEFRLVNEDKSLRWIHWRGQAAVDPVEQNIQIVGVVRDITGRKNRELAIIRLSRIYKVLSNTNQLIIHEKDPENLLKKACRIAIEDGGLLFANIMLLETGEMFTEFQYSSAKDQDKIISLPLPAYDFDDEHVPVTETLKSKRHIFTNNISSVAGQPDWRDTVLRCGGKSAALFQLTRRAELSGIFAVYSSELDFFNENELALFDELVMDISYGVENLEVEIARQKAENELRKLSHVVEQLPLSVIVTDTTGSIVYVNPKFTHISGYTAEEVFGKNPRILKSGDTDREEYTQMWNTICNGNEWKGEFHNRKKNGEFYWESALISPIRDESNNITHFTAIKEDITQNKIIEQKLMMTEYRKSVMSQIAEIFLSYQDERMYIEVLPVLLKTFNSQFGIFGYINQSYDLVIPSLTGEIWNQCAIQDKTTIFPESNWKDSLWGRAIREKQSFISDGPFYTPSGHLEIKNFMVAPIVFQDKSIGLLSLANKRTAYKNDDIEMLQSIAEYISPILNARLQEKWQEEIRIHAEEVLRKSEDKFSKVFHSNPAATAITRIDNGCILDCNDALCEMLGYSWDELIGKSTLSLNIWCDVKEREQLIRMIGDNKPVNALEVRIRNKNGQILTVLDSIEFIRIEDEQFMLSILIDITEQKKAEQQLQEYRVNLENLVKQRTDELFKINHQLNEQLEKEKSIELLLNQSLEKEKELSELKSRFISTTSHEFRTPLASILSSAQLIQRYRQKWNDEKISEHFGRIKHSVENLTHLLDDVLTISRAESGKILCIPQEVDLLSFCKELVEEGQHFATQQHKFIFTYLPEETKFKIDPKLLRFVVLNLLTNAFKYSPDGGTVELQISYVRKKRMLKFIISDEGIGIPSEEKDYLYEPFHRAKNTGEITGTGLGLSIVKRSVELHHGEIQYESQVGKGTKFFVSIPVNES